MGPRSFYQYNSSQLYKTLFLWFKSRNIERITLLTLHALLLIVENDKTLINNRSIVTNITNVLVVSSFSFITIPIVLIVTYSSVTNNLLCRNSISYNESHL